MAGDLRRFKVTLLAAGDLLTAYLSLWLTLILRYGTEGYEPHWPEHVGPFTLVFALWLAIFYIVGLYDFDALRSRIELVSRAAEGLIAAFVVSMGVFYVLPRVDIAPKTNLAIAIAIEAVLLVGWRLLSLEWFSATRFRLKVAFLGGGDEARVLFDILAANPHIGYTPIALLDASAEDVPESDVIVVARGPQSPELTRRLYRKFFQAVSIVDLASFYEKIRHAVPASALDQRWIVDNLAHLETSVYETAKRLFDLAFGLVAAAPALALSPFIAAAIWLEDRGPILYRQQRVGKNGKPFSIVKFRTMRTDAEARGAAFAQENDPRVTRVGKFLRASRLDELPQIWNILRGEMSFVGPRPERPEIEDALSKTIPLFPVRHLVRPGLTGWAQVSAPYAATQEDHLMKLRLDLYYLKYRSIALDAAIILKTVYSVLKRKGR